MTHDEITTALRMLAMGRPNHPATMLLVDALAVVLANPEERLSAIVRDEPTEKPAASEDGEAAPPSDAAKRRGRPPKIKPVEAPNG